MKWLSLLFLIIGLGIFFKPQLDYRLLDKNAKLNQLINEDLKRLELEKKLPKDWNRIRSINLYQKEDDEIKWLKKVKLEIKTNPSGDRHLEVELIPWKLKNMSGATVNYHLLDIKSENSVWEFGRTFELGL